MPVLLTTYGGRGDVEPLVALAVQLRPLGAEVRACAPPDGAERLPLPPELMAFLDAGTPPACVGFAPPLPEAARRTMAAWS